MQITSVSYAWYQKILCKEPSTRLAFQFNIFPQHVLKCTGEKEEKGTVTLNGDSGCITVVHNTQQ